MTVPQSWHELNLAYAIGVYLQSGVAMMLTENLEDWVEDQLEGVRTNLVKNHGRFSAGGA